MKIRILIIVIIITFVLISFAVPNLSKIYDSCEMAQSGTLQFAIGYQWTNGLLYIDNAECTWKIFGIIPIMNLLSEEEINIDTTETIWPHPLTPTIPDVCTDDMINHFKTYSNIFDGEDIFYMETIGLENSINIEDFNQCKEELLENRERSQITRMSCSEIFERNIQGEYKSKQNREIVREKLNDCNRLISSTLDYSECSSIRIIANTPIIFHIEDNLLHLESKIYSCIKNNELELSDISLTHQTSLCNDQTNDEVFFINACKNMQVISQPFKHSMAFEELYPEIIENEQKIIHGKDCSDVRDTYDGKMHLVG